MMSNKIESCILISILIFLAACRPVEGDKTYNLPSEYKTELEDGQIIVFKNQFNIHDTLIVRKVLNGFRETSTTGTWGKPPFDIFEFQNVYIHDINDTLSEWTQSILNSEESTYGDFNNPPELLNDFICTVTGLDDLYSAAGIEYNSKLSWYKLWEAEINNYYEKNLSIEIGNQKYNNVYKFLSDTGQIETMYFTYKDGYLKYDLRNGEKWERIE